MTARTPASSTRSTRASARTSTSAGRKQPAKKPAARKTSKSAALSAFAMRPFTALWNSRVFRSARVRRMLLAGTVIAFLLMVFTVPLTDWVNQGRALGAKQAEFDALADANEQLQTEVNRLQTPEGVREAARNQMGYVLPGEKRVHLLPSPDLPVDLPSAWPYTMVSGILEVRRSIAQADNAPLAPLAP